MARQKKASQFVGNPLVECEPVTLTAIANSLGLSAELPLAHITAPGTALLGDDYFNLWIDLVGLTEVTSETCPGPLLQIDEIRIRLLRQRYYYFSDTVLQQAMTEPFKLNLLTPGIPFYEITWNQSDGLKESFQGLRHIEPNRLGRDGCTFLKQVERVLRHWTKPGRPRVFSRQESYESALQHAKEYLIAQGRSITQEAVAELVGCDVRMIRAWNTTFGLKWSKFKERH